jgi:hypothetical protein
VFDPGAAMLPTTLPIKYGAVTFPTELMVLVATSGREKLALVLEKIAALVLLTLNTIGPLVFAK